MLTINEKEMSDREKKSIYNDSAYKTLLTLQNKNHFLS